MRSTIGLFLPIIGLLMGAALVACLYRSGGHDQTAMALYFVVSMLTVGILELLRQTTNR